MKVSEIAQIVSTLKTALPVGITQVCKDNGLLKRGNPFRDAVKITSYAGLVAADYERSVNNQLGREDKELDFFAQSHAWMVRAEANLGRKKTDDGTRYVPIKVQSSGETRWVLDGADVTAQVQEWRKPTPDAPKTQEALDNKVIWRTPDLASIQTIRMLGGEYTIEA